MTYEDPSHSLLLEAGLRISEKGTPQFFWKFNYLILNYLIHSFQQGHYSVITMLVEIIDMKKILVNIYLDYSIVLSFNVPHIPCQMWFERINEL